MLGRAWSLGATLSLNDGAYVAFAEARAVPPLTTDARLARGVSAVSDIEVIFVGVHTT